MKLNQERIEFMTQLVLETHGLSEEEVGPLQLFQLKSQVMQMEIWHARYNEEYGIMEVEMDPALFEKKEPENDN